MRVVDLSRFQQFTAINLLADPGAVGGKLRVPSCAQITLRWTLGDGKLANIVLYGRFTGTFAGTVAQANGIHTALSSGSAWTALAAFLAPGTSFAGVGIRNVDVVDQPIILSTTTAVPGTSTGTELPNEVALVITLRTANVGRGHRGRMYVPGWATTASGAGNVVAAAAVTALNNWGGTIAAAFSGQGYTWVLGLRERAAYTSPVTGVMHPARPATSEVITQTPVRDNHWDSQRRRGLK